MHIRRCDISMAMTGTPFFGGLSQQGHASARVRQLAKAQAAEVKHMEERWLHRTDALVKDWSLKGSGLLVLDVMNG